MSAEVLNALGWLTFLVAAGVSSCIAFVVLTCMAKAAWDWIKPLNRRPQ